MQRRNPFTSRSRNATNIGYSDSRREQSKRPERERYIENYSYQYKNKSSRSLPESGEPAIKRHDRRYSDDLHNLKNGRFRRNQDVMAYPSSVSSYEANPNEQYTGSNIDPNLGLTVPLHNLDGSQRDTVLRELKAKLHFADDVPSTNLLQTETSPTIAHLGGINPYQSDDYLLGASIFIYNIQNDKWFFSGTIPEPRNYHAAVYFNRKIFIIGGYSPLEAEDGQMPPTRTIFQLSVRSKRWRRKADMRDARAQHSVCLIQEKLMVVGGRGENGQLLSSVELYFPKRDIWTKCRPLPIALAGMSTTVLEGCVWVVGGVVQERSGKEAVSDRVYAFDMLEQRWTEKPPLPSPRAFACACSLKREVWLWGGMTEAGTSSNSVLVLSPEVRFWEQHDSIGTHKHAAAVAKFGRRVFLLGGICNTANRQEVLVETDFYNRADDTYSEGAALPRPIMGGAAVGLPIDFIGSSDPKWNINELDDVILQNAATKIQACFRGYSTRKMLRENNASPASSLVVNKLSHPFPENYHDKWRLFQRVQIEDWPPTPNPCSLPSEVQVKMGTIPVGYVIHTTSSGRSQVKRYREFPEHIDPNMSMCGKIDSLYKHTKTILGLRKMEVLPSFVKEMLNVRTLQHDSFPVVLLTGGLEPKEPVNLAYGKLAIRYNPLGDRFEYYGALPEARNYHAAVYYKGYVYVTGGCDPEKRNSGEMVSTDTTFCLDIKTGLWTRLENMSCHRSHHGLLAYEDRLYAFGGRDQNGRLVASIECYHIESDQWSLKRPMSEKRMGMACAVYEGALWFMGGIGEDPEHPVLESVISYDPVRDEWQSHPPLRCPRAYASGAVANKTLCLVGGVSYRPESRVITSMASVDQYDPEEDEWVRMTHMNTPRHAAAVAAVESCLYVFGGVCSQEWNAVSKTDMIITNNASVNICAPLPIPLTGMAAVTIPPLELSMRAESVALLLHARLTFK